MSHTHPSLTHAPSDLIAGRSEAPTEGAPIESRDPSNPSRVVWSGRGAPSQVARAIAAAREAAVTWARTPRARRVAVLRRYQSLCNARSAAIARLICDETGKALWDCAAEAALLGAKVDITLDEGPQGALSRVADIELSLGASRMGRAWFRPHGVMAVVGPFNFPAHLPNGHIVPALAMGNTVVFKPSDKTPGVGQLLGELFAEALDAEGAPAGVVNVVQGGADVARALVAHDDIDGVLFTGSWPVGRAILEANLDRPGRLLALEMGGNNAAVILPDADLRQAVIECVRSAFVTSGQRCTCTRRLIVHAAVADRVLAALTETTRALRVGDPSLPDTFMGPVISHAARQSVLDAQDRFERAGATVLLRALAMEPSPTEGGFYVTPSVLRVDRFVAREDLSHAGADIEVFGPLLRVSVVDSLDEALAQANATRYGLAASVFTRDPDAIERFVAEARAGCVNVNTGTAGASSKLPFGGLGWSGNHRPAGSFSLDYCAYPVAGMIERGDAAALTPGMRFDNAWLGDAHGARP